MDMAALITRVRDHYVEQFAAFADVQRRNRTQGASEVKLKLNQGSETFQGLYCADFIINDGEVKIIEFQPANILAFDEVSGAFGHAVVTLESLHWDAALIEHDAPSLPPETLAAWFRLWFDPDDERGDQSAALGEVIHSLVVKPMALSIDFGTATPGALWDLVELLETAEAKTIRIRAASERGGL